MGRHADAGRPRGVARWLITAAVVVLVLAGITAGYLIIVNRSDSASDGACTGSVSLPVAAGPGAAAAVSAAADAYNATKPVARSTCVTAAVTTVADAAALAGLTGHWPGDAGPAPGLWVPDNSAALAALDTAQPAMAAGHPSEPLAWSPVVLAVRTGDVPAVASLSWSELPEAAGPDGTAALPGGRHLRLALPPIDANRATSYALQSVLAGTDRSTALGEDDVRSDAGVLQSLGSGAAGDAGTSEKALTALAGGDGAATAVPVVEADLVAFDAGGGTLAAVHPKGPTAGDALIAAPISAGSWVSQNMAAAASDFQAYLSGAHGQQILADHGWRTASAHPSDPVAGVDVTASVTRLPASGPAVDAALASELGQPAPPSPLSTSAPSSAPSTSGASSSPPVSSAPSSASTAPSTGTTATSTETAGSSTSSTGTSGTSTSGATTSTSSTPTTTASSTSNPAASGPVLTVIVDSSAGMAEQADGASLLAWVQKALPAVLGGKITDRAGLWAYADSGVLPPDGYPQLVSTGKLSGKVDGHSRATALKSAVSDLNPSGDRWAYGALIQALKTVPDAAVPHRASRVLLITSGVDETPATPRQMVLDAESAVKGKVRIDVVGLGSAVPVEAYQQIAKTGGGEYIPVPDPSKLGETLTDLYTLGD